MKPLSEHSCPASGGIQELRVPQCFPRLFDLLVSPSVAAASFTLLPV